MKTLLLIMLFLVGCGHPFADVPKLSPLPPDAVILAFGDSLTYGTGAGAGEGESYPDVLQSLVRRTVIRSGVPGEVTADSLLRLPRVLDEHSPKLMVLCIGANDFLRQLGGQQAADNIRAMIRLARQKHVEVVLVGVPEYGVQTSPPEFYPQIAKEFNIPYEGTILREILLNRDLMTDLVHPNAMGYRLIATAVAVLLKKNGAI